MNDLDALKNDIEKLKLHLNILLEKKDVLEPEVIEASKRLDILLTEYYKKIINVNIKN